MENIKHNLELLSKLNQFENCKIELHHKRTGDKAKSTSIENISTSFQSYEVNEKGERVPVSYEEKRGLPASEKTIKEFFNKLYEKEKIDFPELKWDRFLNDEIKYFENKAILIPEYEAILFDLIEVIKKKPKVKNEFENSTLLSLFKDPDKYNALMIRLKEKEQINQDTHIWKDHGSGYMKRLVGIIKGLHESGYFQRKPSNVEIVSICKNTFKVEIGIDTAKHNKSDSSILKEIKDL